MKKSTIKYLQLLFEDSSLTKLGQRMKLKKDRPKLFAKLDNKRKIKNKVFRQIIYDIVYPNSGFCKTCGNPVGFDGQTGWSYKSFCSRKCIGLSPEIIAKKKNTCLKNHGVEFPQQSKKVQKKTKKNFVKNWGVENPSQVKEIQEKKIKTSQERYGTDNPAQSPIVKQHIVDTFIKKYGEKHYLKNTAKKKEFMHKIKEISLEKYGVEHFTQSEEVKQKTIENNLKKYGTSSPWKDEKTKQKSLKKSRKTYKKKTGYEHNMQNPKCIQKIKNTNLKKYGVENPSQRPDIQDKKHCSKKITIKGYTFNYRGCEDIVLLYLINELWINPKDISTSPKDMPEIWYKYKGKKKRYFPDIVYNKKGKQYIIEVKGTYTLGLNSGNSAKEQFKIVQLKAKAAEKECKFQLIIAQRSYLAKNNQILYLDGFTSMTRRQVKSQVLPELKNKKCIINF